MMVPQFTMVKWNMDGLSRNNPHQNRHQLYTVSISTFQEEKKDDIMSNGHCGWLQEVPCFFSVPTEKHYRRLHQEGRAKTKEQQG